MQKDNNSRGKFKLGLIGAGEVVRTLHLPVLQQLPDVQICWVMDANLSKAKSLSANYGIMSGHSCFDDCEDVDAVLLAIPVGVRQEAWQHIIRRGWHVLCEKPVACTVAEFESIITRMQQRGRVMEPGLMRRFYANTQALRSLVASGVFGELVEVWAGEGGLQNRTGRDTDWYQLDRNLSGGGILIETGAHLLDQLMFVCLADEAALDRYEQSPPDKVIEFKAVVEGKIKNASRQSVPFTCSLSRCDDLCNGIHLRFSRLILRMDPGVDGKIWLCDLSGRPISMMSINNFGAKNAYQAFYAEWRFFLERVGGLDRCARAASHDFTKLSVKIIEECYSRLS